MKNILLLALFLLSISLNGQTYFSEAVMGYSMKKTSIINLKNGETIEGQIKKMRYKKALITEVTIKVGEEKRTIPASEIANMYVAQNSFNKIAAGLESATKLENLVAENEMFDEKESEYLKEGYSYYESHRTVYRKDKEADVLLLMVNPFFSGKIKVFDDPLARETVSTGVAGMKVGGHAKSYFIIKQGDEKAYRLKKKDFKKVCEELFDNCEKAKGDKDKFSWLRFDKHVFYYTTECN